MPGLPIFRCGAFGRWVGCTSAASPARPGCALPTWRRSLAPSRPSGRPRTGIIVALQRRPSRRTGGHCRAARAWRMVAVDVDGCDLADGERVVRIHWSAPVADAGGVRRELVRLARAARRVGPVDGHCRAAVACAGQRGDASCSSSDTRRRRSSSLREAAGILGPGRAGRASTPCSSAITSSPGSTPTATRPSRWPGWARWAPARSASSWAPAC